jgi:ubiquinone/menaquinone biosynthesis C-methylase UbiE
MIFALGYIGNDPDKGFKSTVASKIPAFQILEKVRIWDSIKKGAFQGKFSLELLLGLFFCTIKIHSTINVPAVTEKAAISRVPIIIHSFYLPSSSSTFLHLTLARAVAILKPNTMMTTKDEKEQIVRSHYEPRIDKYEKGHETLDWESEESQRKRFQVLADHVPLDGKMLLDVGCGIGDLYTFLKEHNIGSHYTGIDLLEKMVDKAKELHPEGNFLQGDIFTRSPFEEKTFDVAYCSGIFNLNMGDNSRFLKEAIPVFFRHSREWVVFNLLDPDHYVKDSRYCFFRPQEVLPWLKPYASKVEIVEDYVPNDFTVIARI